jgi:hypothetical protein
MAKECNKTFLYFKAIQNLPKLGFCVLEYNIWQPWSIRRLPSSVTIIFFLKNGTKKWPKIEPCIGMRIAYIQYFIFSNYSRSDKMVYKCSFHLDNFGIIFPPNVEISPNPFTYSAVTCRCRPHAYLHLDWWAESLSKKACMLNLNENSDCLTWPHSINAFYMYLYKCINS